MLRAHGTAVPLREATMTESCRILDVDVDCVTLEQALGRLDDFVRSGAPHQIATVNMDFVRLAHSDAEFRDAVNEADLAVADGMPLVWLSRLLGARLPGRITGVDIVERGAALAAARGYSIFLLGGAPGVADAAAAELVRRHPDLRIAGTYAPPFGPFSAEEEARMLAMIREARPHMLFVAFGAPRQDVWLRRHRQALSVPVSVGVGGTFNFLAGEISRAPRWMQRAGLEWAYRLGREPRRLWRRYLLGDLPVLVRIAGGRLLPHPALPRWSRGAAPLPLIASDAEPAAGD